MSRLDIIFPVLPPVIDGIGDHTAFLARAMTKHRRVRILTAQDRWDPIEGVEVVKAFSMDRRSGVLALEDVIRRDPPDWVLLQFNQYSWGRWGVNPFLPLLVRRLKRIPEGPRMAMLAHEDFVPIKSMKTLVVGSIQRGQFLALGRTVDLFLTTIQPWADKYSRWFPDARVGVLPVGANLPEPTVTPTEARKRLGISESTFVVGYFGSVRVDRRVDAVCELVSALGSAGRDSKLLYVGADSTRIRQHVDEAVLIDAGPLPAIDVSNTLVAADLVAAPYVDGVSGRRGGFLAGLRLGIASIGNVGQLTDPELVEDSGTSFELAADTSNESFIDAGIRLASDPERRRRLADGGAEMFARRYSWHAISLRLNEHLD